MAGITSKSLYDTDFVEWTAQTARLLRAGRTAEVDLAHLAEEIEDLGKRDRWAVYSHMERLLLHQIKRRIQPDRETASWRRSIFNSQGQITHRLEDSPSLEDFLVRKLPDIYRRAVRGALIETGLKPAPLPDRCPFTLDQLINQFDLEWPSE